MTVETPPGSAPSTDLIEILLWQHARIRALLTEVQISHGAYRQQAFDTLRELLAVHETAEELVLRPVSRAAAGDATVDTRNHEENKAAHVLAKLETVHVDSSEFDQLFAGFADDVRAHADSEESEEFPAVRGAHSPDKLRELGGRLLAAERRAPTHPHPAATGSPAVLRVVGPFAALLDKARDAYAD